MCGFIGTISNSNIDLDNLIECNKKIICRGPDNTTIYNSKEHKFNFSKEKNFSFIFNRLSIVDLTNLANQPMYSNEFNTLILFNGEIFNHIELRKKLINEGLIFRTKNSDTEVLLLGISYFGKEFVKEVIGQFSIVFVDYNKDNVLMIKDRLSQKPLFYKQNSEELIFGSNLESVYRASKNNQISDESLNEYLQLSVIRSPNTIFADIYKLQPAEIIEFDVSEKINIRKKSFYWDINGFMDEKKFDKDEFYNLMSDSIKIRNQADVEIATFCSGGIDSTSIIKNLSKGNSNINTFTIKFSNKKYDESQWSNKVAETYNTNHFIEELDSDIGKSDIDNIIDNLDELYGDPSLIPTTILSKKMSQKYKVAISGDGGDELFGGYTHLNNLINKRKFNPYLLSYIYKKYNPKRGTGTEILSRSSDLNKAHESYFNDYKLLEVLKISSKKHFFDKQPISKENFIKQIQLRDYKFYLSEMMMLKIDRSSMANSLEVRSPFVDHRLIEYMFSHDFYRNKKYKSKPLLKEYLSDDFTDNFLNREKKGFAFDIENWILKNQDFVKEVLIYGKYIKNFNKNVFQDLNMFKSRMNGIRIWKLYLLEKYLERF